jgi:hypothetical protein
MFGDQFLKTVNQFIKTISKNFGMFGDQ